MNGIGEVYTYRKQGKVNKGYGFYDPNKVFTKTDENGKVKVDDVLSTICKANEANTVIISNKVYKTVKIGNQVWLAENLDYTDNNVVLGTDCFYYNDDAEQSYGLLYLGSSVSKLDNIKTGWHVPTQTDFETLIAIVGGVIEGGHFLKSKTSWTSLNGIDSLGFDGKAAGMKTSNGYNNKGNYGIFWSKTTNESSQNYRIGLQNSNDALISNFLNNSVGCSVRLVKD